MLDHAIRLDFSTWTQLKDHEKQEAAYEKLRAELAPILDKLEKHPRSPSYTSYYRLTPTGCKAILALLTDLEKRKGARLNVWIYEWVDDAASAKAEWFRLEPETEFDVDYRMDGITRVKADRIKGRNAVRQYNNKIFVSQAARDALVGAGFAAFETFWVADTGKYRATQWYHLVPTAFIGRGIDHPWFDPKKRGQFKLHGFAEVQPKEDPWRRGVNIFETRQLRVDPPEASPELRKLLNFLRASPMIDYEFSTNAIHAPLRLLRNAIPKKVDIAYFWGAKPQEGRDATQYTPTCVARKARDFMIKQRLASPRDFQAMIVLDRPPKGAEVFDEERTPAPPIFSPAEVKKMRALEAKLLAKFEASPKPEVPVKPVPMKPLLSKLKREIKKRGSEVYKGASAADIARAAKAAGRKVPARWAEVLATVDGFELDNCAIFDGEGALRGASCVELPEAHQSRFNLIRLGWPDMPAGYLAVGDSDLGDPIFLDTAAGDAEDCPVVFVDHETSEVVQTWPSITLFLKDALEPPEQFNCVSQRRHPRGPR